MANNFQKRSYQLERIDTGDYTPPEYERFLREISLVNRLTGDNRALKNSLLHEIKTENLREFSVLDVGAGSGEFLRLIAKTARKQKRRANLFGLELHPRSARAILEESPDFAEIRSISGDGLNLPFYDNSFDYAICSLFTHHFTDENVIQILSEMARVARRKIFVIDLHRHKAAHFSYQIFCAAFRISPLVRKDGSLSILRSFVPSELKNLAEKAKLQNIKVKRRAPFRLVLEATKAEIRA